MSEAAVVDAGDAHAEGDGEGGLLGGEGHLVQHDALEVALVLGGAAQVDELLLRATTRGTTGGRRSVRLGVWRVAACVRVKRGWGGRERERERERLLNLRPPAPAPSPSGPGGR